MQLVTGLGNTFAIGMISAGVFAKLPLSSEEIKAKVAEVAAKGAWSEKVGAYQLCLSQDRTVAAYKRCSKAADIAVRMLASSTPCADPRPYVALITTASKPLESSGARCRPARPYHRQARRQLRLKLQAGKRNN